MKKKDKKKRTLYVKKTSQFQLFQHGWPTHVVISNPSYIQCNKKGKVNWDKASVYNHEELIEKNNVKIIS